MIWFNSARLLIAVTGVAAVVGIRAGNRIDVNGRACVCGYKNGLRGGRGFAERIGEGERDGVGAGRFISVAGVEADELVVLRRRIAEVPLVLCGQIGAAIERGIEGIDEYGLAGEDCGGAIGGDFCDGGGGIVRWRCFVKSWTLRKKPRRCRRVLS